MHARFYTKQSDAIAAYEAYTEWASIQGRSNRERYCTENYMSHNSFQSIQDVKTQLGKILYDIGYICESIDHNHNSMNHRLIKAVIMAGSYPNIAMIKLPVQKYDKTYSGTVSICPNAKEIKMFTKEDGIS
jgi:HrpA-like RNA helicase